MLKEFNGKVIYFYACFLRLHISNGVISHRKPSLLHSQQDLHHSCYAHDPRYYHPIRLIRLHQPLLKQKTQRSGHYSGKKQPFEEHVLSEDPNGGWCNHPDFNPYHYLLPEQGATLPHWFCDHKFSVDTGQPVFCQQTIHC